MFTLYVENVLFSGDAWVGQNASLPPISVQLWLRIRNAGVFLRNCRRRTCFRKQRGGEDEKEREVKDMQGEICQAGDEKAVFPGA